MQNYFYYFYCYFFAEELSQKTRLEKQNLKKKVFKDCEIIKLNGKCVQKFSGFPPKPLEKKEKLKRCFYESSAAAQYRGGHHLDYGRAILVLVHGRF